MKVCYLESFGIRPNDCLSEYVALLKSVYIVLFSRNILTDLKFRQLYIAGRSLACWFSMVLFCRVMTLDKLYLLSFFDFVMLGIVALR